MNDTTTPVAAESERAATRSREANPYTPSRLLGVALLGAGCSLVAYYLFQQLDPEQRRGLQDSALRGARAQLQGWIAGSDGEPS